MLAKMSVAAEELHLTTYYPAPFGSYDRLRLVPRTSFLPGDCDEPREVGVMYYDDGKDKNPEGIYVCQKFDQNGFGWVFVSKPYASEKTSAEDKQPLSFTKDPVISAQKVVCVKPDKSLGACLNNPSADGTCACQ
jgi:hypothetical protein